MLVILPLVATALSAGLWLFGRESAPPYEAIAIFAVVLHNAVMGYIQESRGHSRRVISGVLYEAYDALLRDGRAVTREEIERDAGRLFEGNFSRRVGL